MVWCERFTCHQLPKQISLLAPTSYPVSDDFTRFNIVLPFYQAQTFESELLGSPRCGRELLLNIELFLLWKFNPTADNRSRRLHPNPVRSAGSYPGPAVPPAGWVFLDPGLNV